MRRVAKNTRTKLYITKSCVSDWYVGFTKTNEPKVFKQPDPVLAQSQSQDFKYIEGPFSSPEEAKQAVFKISGKLVPWEQS